MRKNSILQAMALASVMGLAEPMGKGNAEIEIRRQASMGDMLSMAMGGGRNRGRNRTGGIKSSAVIAKRPCLHCEKKHTHAQPFCSADCKTVWSSDHPHNGKQPAIMSTEELSWQQAHKMPHGRVMHPWQVKAAMAINSLSPVHVAMDMGKAGGDMSARVASRIIDGSRQITEVQYHEAP